MVKKKAPKPNIMTSLRFKSEEEREEFKRVAELEGFSTTASWMMYHLRNQAKKTLDQHGRENS